jgi:hypothetical protein
MPPGVVPEDLDMESSLDTVDLGVGVGVGVGIGIGVVPADLTTVISVGVIAPADLGVEFPDAVPPEMIPPAVRIKFPGIVPGAVSR